MSDKSKEKLKQPQACSQPLIDQSFNAAAHESEENIFVLDIPNVDLRRVEQGDYAELSNLIYNNELDFSDLINIIEAVNFYKEYKDNLKLKYNKKGTLNFIEGILTGCKKLGEPETVNLAGNHEIDIHRDGYIISLQIPGTEKQLFLPVPFEAAWITSLGGQGSTLETDSKANQSIGKLARLEFHKDGEIIKFRAEGTSGFDQMMCNEESLPAPNLP